MVEPHAIKDDPKGNGRETPAIRGPLRVRDFVTQDIPEVIELGAEMHKETAYAHLPYNRDKLARTANMAMTSKYITGWVVEDTSTREIIACMCACVEDYFFCDELYAHDVFIFVKKEHRTTPFVVLRLVREFERWATQNFNVRELRFGNTTEYKAEKVGKFYSSLGYEQVGTLHVKRL